MIILFATLLILFICLFVYWASFSSLSSGPEPRPFVTSDFAQSNDGNIPVSDDLQSEVVVMTWNIGFAYGEGSEGNGYIKRSEHQMKMRLEEVKEVINKYSPDIVFLQEVDFDSDRSHNVDQLASIAKDCGFAHYAYAPSWQHNYVPFPYWPISNQWGKMKSGGGILSRYPIDSNKVNLYPKPNSNPFWYNLFYLYRYSQNVRIKINTKEIQLVNNHLEAFDQKTRQSQATELAKKLLLDREKQVLPLIVAGDFNTSVDDQYDQTYQKIEDLAFIREIISLNEYQQNKSKWFTFSALSPDRRLDYIFVSKEFEVIKNEVGKTKVSDHLPIISHLLLKD